MGDDRPLDPRLNAQDRREVNRWFKDAVGRRLEGFSTTRAFGYPADEAGTITLDFGEKEGAEVRDTLTIELTPTGYDPDGIGVSGGLGG